MIDQFKNWKFFHESRQNYLYSQLDAYLWKPLDITEQENLKFFLSFCTFWRLLDRIEAKTKVLVFWSKVSVGLLNSPSPHLWYEQPKTTIILTSPPKGDLRAENGFGLSLILRLYYCVTWVWRCLFLYTYLCVKYTGMWCLLLEVKLSCLWPALFVCRTFCWSIGLSAIISATMSQ